MNPTDRRRIRLSLPALLLGSPWVCHGFNGFSSGARGTTGAQFLELPVGARGVAMGGAQTAMADDATALYYNPAALANIEHGSLAFMHSAYFAGISYDYLAVALRRDAGTFAGSAQYLSPGTLDEVDNAGKSTGGGFHPMDIALTLGFARDVSGILDLGGGVKYISSKIHSSANTVALDLGTRLKLEPFTLGASLANIGKGLNYGGKTEDLPLTLRLGSGIPIGKTVLSCDLHLPRGASPLGALGLEWNPKTGERAGFSARLGFNSRTLSSDLGVMAAMSAGVGFSVGGFRVDYAFVPFGDLGITHRVGTVLRWGSRAEDAAHFERVRPESPARTEREREDVDEPAVPERDSAAEIDGLFAQADRSLRARRHAEARRSLLRAYKLLYAEPVDSRMVRYYERMGRIAFAEEDYDGAEKKFREALYYAEKAGGIEDDKVRVLMGDINAGIGLCLAQSGEAEAARRYFKKGLSLGLSQENRRLIGQHLRGSR